MTRVPTTPAARVLGLPAATGAPIEPEHGGDRRRFVIWSLMLGFIPPQRVVECVLADLAEEAAA